MGFSHLSWHWKNEDESNGKHDDDYGDGDDGDGDDDVNDPQAVDTGLQWKSIKGKGEIESCLGGQCLCQVIVTMTIVWESRHTTTTTASKNPKEKWKWKSRLKTPTIVFQGEHADCRGRGLTAVPSSTEGRTIKSL